ncbi:chain length determinant protein, partial [Gammaproteobacteria bacterium]|nr:chain length determinant protein [Gammaproteobacteria bacterium]
LITVLVTAAAILFSFLLPNVYQSKALLAPQESMGAMTGSIQNYNNLANLAGVNFNSKLDSGNKTKAMKKVVSLSFFENNILPKIYLPNLMAVDSFDHQSKILIYDENIFDKATEKWVRDFNNPKKSIPSPQEGFKVFLDEHLVIDEDQKTGFVAIAINHQSPFIAQKWTELIVIELNEFFRKNDKEQAEKSIKYLTEQMVKSSFAEIRQAIAALIQQETQNLSLIEAKKEYVFAYIDPPAVMEEKEKPNRAIIVFIGFLFGSFFGAIIVLVRHYAVKKTTV